MRDDRGAVAVLVAILMVPLLGFAAVTIDVAAMYAERQQLQTGADAGALAIAQDCAWGACGATSRTAQTFATSNLRNASSSASVSSLSPSQVTVRNSGIKQHLFAPVLGIDSSAVSASATAAWGSPTGGTAELPLAFSWCEWQAQTGGALPSGTTERVVSFPKKSDTGCTSQSGKQIPGGFGWLQAGAGSCHSTSAISARVGSFAGDAPSSGCSATDLVAQQGKTVILPLFDDYEGSAGAAWYRIQGYAAFKITGYYLGGQFNWGSPCGGSDRCVKGYFTRLVDLNDTFSYDPSAPAFGAAIVQLTH
jgi:hypothetical protein